MSDDIRRINVAVNEAEKAALFRLINEHGVSLTEAVRRLIGYGDFVHRLIVDDRASLTARYPGGATHEINLVGYTPPEQARTEGSDGSPRRGVPPTPEEVHGGR